MASHSLEGVYRTLGAGQTVSGREILIRSTHRENHFRSRLSELSWSVVSSLSRHGLSESLLAQTIQSLRLAKEDPRHYGENSPGMCFDDRARTPVVPDPNFNYWNLLEYGLSGKEGFAGFAKSVGLDPAIDNATLCGLIALLLIDASVEHLDNDEPFRAAAEALDASLCVEQMFYDRGYRHILKEARSDLARRGGVAAHRETDAYKIEVISKWKSGVFKTKAEAARWAMREFPLRNQEVIARWLREAERADPLTRLDE